MCEMQGDNEESQHDDRRTLGDCDRRGDGGRPGAGAVDVHGPRQVGRPGQSGGYVVPKDGPRGRGPRETLVGPFATRRQARNPRRPNRPDQPTAERFVGIERWGFGGLGIWGFRGLVQRGERQLIRELP